MAAGSPIRKPLGYQQLTTINTATTLAPPEGATYAIIQADADAGVGVRWRDDTTAPTTVVGMEIAAGSEEYYTGDLSAVQIIGKANSAKVNVSFYS